MEDHEIVTLKIKADKWDALEKKIAAFYIDENGDEIESDKFDLGDIGEVAAMAFGLL